jgi:hypothetical protein
MTNDLRTKLTAEQVVEIRAAVAAGTISHTALADWYGISRAYIDTLARGDARLAAGGQMQRRTRPRSNTGYFGVCANGAGNRFVVTIRENGKQKSIGYLKDPIEAARLYDARARELGFPPEKLNFPEE